MEVAEHKEYLDEATGFRLVFEPEEHDPHRLTAYVPEDTSHLTQEQCEAALQRLIQRRKADEATQHMTSQAWHERRDSRKQCTPHFTWVEFRRSYSQLVLSSQGVTQCVINYLIWKATMQEQARQDAKEIL